MGSYPRFLDSTNSTYELFGPVNLFWSTRYDKAMTLYLICLQEQYSTRGMPQSPVQVSPPTLVTKTI
ncbi:hypothetical protein F2Q69_00049692 [Brassica cretica]|uniref:Uncharacterized protein n=2 Tax=Brassica cretica TaxID=69181 RepID=A0A8S9PY74_BRACR|nr:hypothetical protein DY000_02061942 [Brassica cretica]KAF3526278.1 hypothetical protein F2Q69_00049692 [Brassica cretica]